MPRTDEERLQHLNDRLALLEASDEQIDLIHGVWADLADDPAGRRQLYGTGDGQLVRLIRDLEAHEADQPRGPVPDPDLGFDEHDSEALVQLVAGKIAHVKAWVGTNPDRAQAALEVEEDFENPRPTLIAWLQTAADRG